MIFLNPAAWLFVILLGLVVLLYLWQQRRERIDVPSLLLWSTIPDDARRTRRPPLDLLLILQLLLLTLLIAGLARPFIADPPALTPRGRHIVVLDTSASMQARDGTRTRFASARDRAQALFSATSLDDEMMLIAASSRARVLVPFTDDRSRLYDAVDHLVPDDTGTRLEAALALAQQASAVSPRPAVIHLITDAPVNGLLPRLLQGTRVVAVGRPVDNVAITGVDIHREHLESHDTAGVEIRVESFARDAVHGWVEARLNDRPLAREPLELAPGERRTMSLQGLPEPGVLRVSLDLTDALPVDDVAYARVAPDHSVRVLLVSDHLPFREDVHRVAAATDRLDLRSVFSNEYYSFLTEETDVTIFHEITPPQLPLRPILFVTPTPGNLLCPPQGDPLGDMDVLDWDDTHPALAGMAPLTARPFLDVRPVRRREWARALLWSRTKEKTVPLVLVGETQGRRVACLAFRVEQLLRTDQEGLLMLFLRVLHWLTPDLTPSVSHRAGETRLVSIPEEGGTLTDPLGGSQPLPTGEAVPVALEHAGVYRLDTSAGSTTFVVNLFDRRESDLREVARARDVEAGEARPIPGPTSGQDLDLWLYAAAAVLFAIEWLVALRS